MYERADRQRGGDLARAEAVERCVCPRAGSVYSHIHVSVLLLNAIATKALGLLTRFSEMVVVQRAVQHDQSGVLPATLHVLPRCGGAHRSLHTSHSSNNVRAAQVAARQAQVGCCDRPAARESYCADSAGSSAFAVRAGVPANCAVSGSPHLFVQCLDRRACR